MVNKTDSVTFYNQNAEQFIVDTLAVDMTSLYDKFLPLLPTNAHILDAGCGSGRDSKYFIEQGFKVTAIDASEKLAQAAATLIKQPVIQCTFQEFTSVQKFQGIWACASLLHVPSEELPNVFNKLANVLTPTGKFYCSFKYGKQDTERNGRYFTNVDEQRLTNFINHTSLSIEDIWLTGDLRPGRENECWLNAILSHFK